MREFSKREKELLSGVIEDTEKLMSKCACKNNEAIREYPSEKYDKDVLRTQFSIDADKILHSAFYNRGNDKTQVFSFYRNDDITRRASHVQLVSRIARIIGRALRLNLDLIEAIAIGHDVGHTPFGHKGEEFLNTLYFEHTGRYFNHNVHSVRALQKITGCNLTLQTLDGILCHCGEKAFSKYEPASINSFSEFNVTFEKCYTENGYIKKLRPSTLEGCVVRISDLIAYLGKDRQDAAKARLGVHFDVNPFGDHNPDIITAIVTDVVENSFDCPYLSMSDDVYNGISAILAENNEKIYQCEAVTQPYYEIIKPMMELLYSRFLSDLQSDDYNSLIYKHYLNRPVVGDFYRHPERRYVQTKLHNPNDIVTDFIASMTDDYFVDAFKFLFKNHPLSKEIKYIEYFDEKYM